MSACKAIASSGISTTSKSRTTKSCIMTKAPQAFHYGIVEIFIRIEQGHAASGLRVVPNRLVDLVGVSSRIVPVGSQVGRRQARIALQNGRVRLAKPAPF